MSSVAAWLPTGLVAAEFMNIGRNMVFALKSGPVVTGTTVMVATALKKLRD